MLILDQLLGYNYGFVIFTEIMVQTHYALFMYVLIFIIEMVVSVCYLIMIMLLVGIYLLIFGKSEIE
jgi:hypothetical protein